MAPQNRTPKGVPTGGQFAPAPHAEVDIPLGFPSSAEVVAPDSFEVNDMVSEMADRLGANIDDVEKDELTHRFLAAFEEAQRRTAYRERIAATVGADSSTAARALAEVGDKLGLELKRDPHVDFDDWQADLGNGRAIVLSPSDPNRITFVDQDGEHHVADVVDQDEGGAPSWPRFDQDGGTGWLRRVRPFITEARNGGDLAQIVERLENP